MDLSNLGIAYRALGRADVAHCSTAKVPPPLAASQLGSGASSGRTKRLWAARHSQAEAGPLGSPATASAARASRLHSRRFRRL